MLGQEEAHRHNDETMLVGSGKVLVPGIANRNRAKLIAWLDAPEPRTARAKLAVLNLAGV